MLRGYDDFGLAREPAAQRARLRDRHDLRRRPVERRQRGLRIRFGGKDGGRSQQPEQRQEVFHGLSLLVWPDMDIAVEARAGGRFNPPECAGRVAANQRIFLHKQRRASGFAGPP